ncbi:MAG: hypothetical protein AB7O28_20845 [Vicinamibacterales bacterium]
MTFAAAITAFADRVLTCRSFDLIVAPALADFAFDRDAPDGAPRTGYLAVLAAVGGALWDDVVRGGLLGTFAGLAVIPLSYYSIWFLLWLEQGMARLSREVVAGIALSIVALSLVPVLVCFWPSPLPRRAPTEPR